jgi:hypothetical protein
MTRQEAIHTPQLLARAVGPGVSSAARKPIHVRGRSAFAEQCAAGQHGEQPLHGWDGKERHALTPRLEIVGASAVAGARCRKDASVQREAGQPVASRPSRY